MKKSLIAFALCSTFFAVTVQAAVVYQFNSNLTVSVAIYSDFLLKNLGGPYPTFLSSFCVSKDASYPCQGVGSLNFLGSMVCLDNIDNCIKYYGFSEYDPKTGSIVGYRSTFRYVSNYGFFVPYELVDPQQYGTTGSPAYLTISDLSSVPEPSTWLMLIAGFGAAGAMLRYRRVQFSSGQNATDEPLLPLVSRQISSGFAGCI